MLRFFFQNANHSVRVTDEFMRAVVDDKDWWTKNVIDGQPNEKLRGTRFDDEDFGFNVALRGIRECSTTRR